MLRSTIHLPPIEEGEFLLCYVKPGITGMWQASGRSDITDFEEVVKLDTEYIENWSIGLDCRILLKTVRSVVKSEGSV